RRAVIVDEDVDPAESLAHGVDHARAILDAAAIRWDRENIGAGLAANPLGGFLEVSGPARRDGNFCALRGEHAGNAVTDALARAADDRKPVLQEEIHLKSQALQERFRVLVEYMLQHFLGIAFRAPVPHEALVGE